MKNAEIKALIRDINSSDSEEDNREDADEDFSDDSQEEDMDMSAQSPGVATVPTRQDFEDEEELSNESENEEKAKSKAEESSVPEEVNSITVDEKQSNTVEETSTIENDKSAGKNEEKVQPKETKVAKSTKSTDKNQEVKRHGGEKQWRSSRKRKSKKEVEMETDQLIGELAVDMKNRKANHKKEVKAREKDSEYLFASTILAEIKKMPYPLMCMAKNDINQVLFKYQMMMLSSQSNSSSNQINQSMPQNRINQSVPPNRTNQFMSPNYVNQAMPPNNLHQLMPQSNNQQSPNLYGMQYTRQQNPLFDLQNITDEYGTNQHFQNQEQHIQRQANPLSMSGDNQVLNPTPPSTPKTPVSQVREMYHMTSPSF